MFYYLEKTSAMQNVVKVIKKSDIRITDMDVQFGANVAIEYESVQLPTHITYVGTSDTIRPATEDEIKSRDQIALIAGLGLIGEFWHKGNFNPDTLANVNHTHSATDIITDSEHLFVSSTEKQAWNNKVNNTGTYLQLTSGNSLAVNGVEFHMDDMQTSIQRVWGSTTDKHHAYMMDANSIRRWLNVENGSTNYQHPATHPATMIVQSPNYRFVTDDNISFWNAKSPAHGHPYLALTGGYVTGNIYLTGKIQGYDIEATSDRTLKKDIKEQRLSKEDIDRAIKGISCYQYKFISDPNEEEYLGFIAQEWQEVFGEECVSTGEDGKLHIRTGGVMAKMWMLIQELYRRMERGVEHGE